MSLVLSIRQGAVHLPASVVAAHLAGVAAVVVLIRDGALMVYPVRQATAGGCLLKIRNAAGDRVAEARDVLLAHGLLDLVAEALPARWSEADGALVAALPAEATPWMPGGQSG